MRILGLLALISAFGLLTGCYAMRSSAGGGETAFTPPREIRTADIALPTGYRIEPVVTGLTFPTGVSFDEQGRAQVVEAGYAYGEEWAEPRLIRIEPGGEVTVIASGRNPPWNGVDFHEGAFYVAEGGVLQGGRILRITPDGAVIPLVEQLPSVGDHHTNGPLVGPDGWVYFGQGTATNAAVVGEDNYNFGWLERFPAFHDVPCRDVLLAGRNFVTANPLSRDRRERVSTGAFVPFGTVTTEGQVVRGQVPCSGAILRVRSEGGGVELVAWGLRNPFGLGWSPEGRLYITDNSYDDRGSRPVWGAGDMLWTITPGTWYGWPDFHAGRPLADADRYSAPAKPHPGFVLAEHPGAPPRPAAMLGVHSSSNGFDFSRNPSFGHVGEAFVAQFGDMAPGVGKVMAPAGFRVVRVNVQTGVVEDSAVNLGRAGGPASWLGSGGLERPVAARFSPDGTALYVVDFGVMTVHRERPWPRAGTGVLWRITRTTRVEP